MKKIQSNKQYVIKKAGSECGDLLDQFLARLNPSRITDGYDPLTHASLATFLTKVLTKDLYTFYKECDWAKNFSKLFGGS